ncbi:MAG: DUF177 domain-containing protein [Clostridia bacterium]
MIIKVAAELKQPGKIGMLHFVCEREPMEYLGRMVSFAAPVMLDAKYAYDGDGFNVTGSFSTVLNSVCTKCNAEFKEPFTFDFSERYERIAATEDSDCYGYTGDEIDIDQMILDNLLQNIPMYSVCSEDCKGLCPICGCDLNNAQCSCAQDATVNPFLVLTKLLDDDKEV